MAGSDFGEYVSEGIPYVVAPQNLACCNLLDGGVSFDFDYLRVVLCCDSGNFLPFREGSKEYEV